MTRRDYVRIAAALRETQPKPIVRDAIYGEVLQQWRGDVRALADMLALDNPRFDRARFYAAAEGGKA